MTANFARTLTALAALILAAPALAQSQPKAPANTPAKAAAPATAWTYGEHPLWGLSAHVTAGPHSVGLRCLKPAGQGPVVAVDYTAALSSDGKTISYQMPGTDGSGSYPVDAKGAYVEGAGSACAVSLPEFQKAKTLILDDGAEKPKVIARIPLTGAKAAIDRLIAACPSIKADLDNCGL